MVDTNERHIHDLALGAFESSYERFSAQRHSVEAAYAPAGEALFWTIVCDDGYEAILGKNLYWSSRSSDVDGSLIVGVRWARNRMTHHRALVLDKHYGTELGTLVLGRGVLGTVDHMKWALADAVPRTKGSRQNKCRNGETDP